jgi:glycosyltransferase involved in cell wall biosynthesis
MFKFQEVTCLKAKNGIGIRSNAKCKNLDVNVKPVIEAIVPTINEGHAVTEVLIELRRFTDRILVIDAYSKDKTVEIAESLGAKVVMQNGMGKGSALREAFDCVNSDIIVILDGDGSMKPEEVPLLLKAMTPGVDVVKGSRFLPGGGSEDLSLLRTLGNLFFVSLVNWLWSTNYTDLCYGFGAFRSSALNRLCPRLESINFEIETEMFIKAKKLGLKVVEVPSIEYRRKHGKSNLNFVKDGFRILRTIIREIAHKK